MGFSGGFKPKCLGCSLAAKPLWADTFMAKSHFQHARRIVRVKESGMFFKKIAQTREIAVGRLFQSKECGVSVAFGPAPGPLKQRVWHKSVIMPDRESPGHAKSGSPSQSWVQEIVFS